jgi:hypothetical protein
MKPGISTSKPFPSKPDEKAAAIQAAPERAHDPESPYDPNNPAAVGAFWKEATVHRPVQRGAVKKGRKVSAVRR